MLPEPDDPKFRAALESLARAYDSTSKLVDDLPEPAIFTETFEAVLQFVKDYPEEFKRVHYHDNVHGRGAYIADFEEHLNKFGGRFPHGYDLAVRMYYWANLARLHLNARWRIGPEFPPPIQLLSTRAEKITGQDIVYEVRPVSKVVKEKAFVFESSSSEEDDEEADGVEEEQEEVEETVPVSLIDRSGFAGKIMVKPPQARVAAAATSEQKSTIARRKQKSKAARSKQKSKAGRSKQASAAATSKAGVIPGPDAASKSQVNATSRAAIESATSGGLAARSSTAGSSGDQTSGSAPQPQVNTTSGVTASASVNGGAATISIAGPSGAQPSGTVPGSLVNATLGNTIIPRANGGASAGSSIAEPLRAHASGEASERVIAATKSRSSATRAARAPLTYATDHGLFDDDPYVLGGFRGDPNANLPQPRRPSTTVAEVVSSKVKAPQPGLPSTTPAAPRRSTRPSVAAGTSSSLTKPLLPPGHFENYFDS